MISKQKLIELRQKSKALDPVVRVGKNGLSDGLVEQVRKALQRRRLIKVKMLQSFAEENDARGAAEELARKTGAEIISVVGFNVTLYSEKPTSTAPVNAEPNFRDFQRAKKAVERQPRRGPPKSRLSS
jgi:RNA-binding protein